MARIRVDPLNIKFPIVDPKTGTPTPAFMRLWQNLFGNDDDNATTIQDVVTDLRDNVIESADSTIVVTGSGSLLDGPVELAADPQAILNKLGSAQGSILYRGATTWSALGPGTSGYVLTTNGASADPTWDATAPATPALTHNHIFVGNSSGLAADVAMSGDATIADTGAVTLANTAVPAGSYGDSSHYTTFTVDAKGRLTAAGTQAVPTVPVAANPSGLIGLTANNGVATTFERSDATHALDQSISPTWTGNHTFSNPILVPNGSAAAPAVNLNSNAGVFWDAGNSAIGLSIAGNERWQFADALGSGTKTGAGIVFNLSGEGAGGYQSFVYATGANAPLNVFGKAEGSIASPTAPPTGRSLGTQRFRGWQAVTGAFQTGAEWRVVTKETSWSNTAAGTITAVFNCAAGSTTLTQHTQLEAEHQQFLGPIRIGSPVTTAPATSMLLDLVSTTGALGVPTMTTTQKSALTASDRMVVYDSTLGLFQFRQGGAWVSPGGATFANPSATASDTAVNGVATTAMRSDAAPAIQKGLSSQFGVVQVDGTSIVSVGGVLSTASGGSGGYVAGTPPTVVQVAHSVAGGNSAVFGVAPTNGNLLVAMCFNPASNTAGSGWTSQTTNSTGTDFGTVLTKVAGAGESTTQTPMSGVTTTGCMVIWELHAASTPTFIAAQSQSETTGVVNIPVLLPNIVNCIGLAALSAVSNNIANLFNLGTSDFLDNTNANRKLGASHTDLSKTPMAGLFGSFGSSTNSKGATALISS